MTNPRPQTLEAALLALGGAESALTRAMAETRQRDGEILVLFEALEAAQSVLWMAERYAEAGGAHGPELEDYRRAQAAINDAMTKLESEAPNG